MYETTKKTDGTKNVIIKRDHFMIEPTAGNRIPRKVTNLKLLLTFAHDRTFLSLSLSRKTIST